MSPRRVTLAEVAERAGVSRSTASLVLAGRSRELRISHSVEQQVIATAKELDYRRNAVSVGLRTGTTRTIGFVSDTVATSRLAGDMIKGAVEAAREHDLLLFIGETEGDDDLERGLLQAMHDRQVDGIIFASMFTRIVDVPTELTAGPAVLLNAVAKRASTLSSVVPDEVGAGRSAARVLVDAGHRDGIHLIGAGPRVRDVPTGAVAGVERLTGIREVFAAANIKIAGGRICSDWQPEQGYEATRELLERTRPRALICLNDRIAVGACQALDDFGLKVPTDVSIVSFDDHPVASWMRPKLTSIALPHYELGRKAFEVLLGEINRDRDGGAPLGEQHRLPMPVRVRDSVAAPTT